MDKIHETGKVEYTPPFVHSVRPKDACKEVDYEPGRKADQTFKGTSLGIQRIAAAIK